ncbi:hypothetical protein CKM354_000987000 [Cercospora kikuchii]|uniref:Uncharacterized protein n=1 Tax=Cercospora kikuchii TaxID=84275 RepID=A0A9P3FJE6_9PEZI|nr:uncharacterized protein CKM354_000987000 [Cercospora kikuchii]GIZ46757.1 hypothetical protein CKM354_000987000 [Cercospora kikuchii]
MSPALNASLGPKYELSDSVGHGRRAEFFKCNWDENQRFCEDENFAHWGGTGNGNDMAWWDKMRGGDRCCLGHGTIEKGSTCNGGRSPSAAGKKAVKHPHA